MHVIKVNNVREALPLAVEYLVNYGLRETSRQGDIFAAPGPVAILYHNPKQHVLLNPIRDANPFFHLMESMWMMAGRQDGVFLDHYVKNFSKDFGVYGIIPDAYGYRWRYGLMFNQLDKIVEQLSTEPTNRQCVLQMWGAGDRHDLLTSYAKACNLVATFRIVNNKLDMSVFNRSNDVIWGCCGANAVHFPLLQEYLAGRIGVEIGNYWQISTNLHLYLRHIQMLTKRIGRIEEGKNLAYYLTDDSVYGTIEPLMLAPTLFDRDLLETMLCIDQIHENKEIIHYDISNRFLREVVLPMALAHQCYKNKDTVGAYDNMNDVIAEDWKTAGIQWLDRRYSK